MAKLPTDLLHPLTSLVWRKCAEAPVRMTNQQAIYHDKKIYVGGGKTFFIETDSIILCYDPRMDSWMIIKSPVYQSALTTYQGKLVLVGGWEDRTRHDSNKLLSLQYDDSWTAELPPMPTPRWGASAVNTGSHLVVAGGEREQQLAAFDVVEVFDGRQWTRTEPLPMASSCMKSTLHNGKWYLMGGVWQSKSVFCATVDSLIATAGSCESKGGSVWKTLPEAPFVWSSSAMYGNQLLAIGGCGDSQDSPQSAIYGYVTDTQSWVHIEDLPVPVHSTCSITLPSGELLVVGGVNDKKHSSSVCKARLRDPFLDGKLSMGALSRLQYAVSVPLFENIGRVWKPFVQSLRMGAANLQESELPPSAAGPEVIGRKVVKVWLKGECGKPPTWRSLIEVLESFPQLAPLSEAINNLFVTPLFEQEIDHLERHLYRKEETIQQLREEQQLAIQREKVLVMEKEALVKENKMLLQQLATHQSLPNRH